MTEFYQWLHSSSPSISLKSEQDGDENIFVKMPYAPLSSPSDNTEHVFDFLYTRSIYENRTSCIGSRCWDVPMDYMGMYSRETGEIYGAGKFDWETLMGEAIGDVHPDSIYFLASLCTRDVNVCIDELIANNNPPLHELGKLTNKQWKQCLYEYEHHVSKPAARKSIVFGEPIIVAAATAFSAFERYMLRFDDMLDYFVDPQGTANRIAAEFIKNNPQKVLLAYEKMRVFQKEYETAYPNKELHIMRQIREAALPMGKSSMMTIKVRDSKKAFHAYSDVLLWDGADKDTYTVLDSKNNPREVLPYAIEEISYGDRVVYRAS